MYSLLKSTAARMVVWGGSIAVLPLFAHAQAPPKPITDTTTLIAQLCYVSFWVFSTAIVLSVLMVLYSSFLYLTSAGDANRIDQAKKTLIYAAVGIVVALIAGGLPDLVANIMGVSLDSAAQCS